MRVLVLQHIACEPPAVYEDVMVARGWEVVRVELDEGEQPPPWQEVDAIVAMGGPMGAYDEAEHPWLAGEKALDAATLQRRAEMLQERYRFRFALPQILQRRQDNPRPDGGEIITDDFAPADVYDVIGKEPRRR